MATDFTQDSVLLFLRSSGGSVKNADLLLHFRPFLQDPANRDRNRELFKKFVNSLAIVKQVDGVSHVLLRKKFRGPGAGPDSPVPTGNHTEPSMVNPAPPSETGRKTVLPAAGLKVTTTNPTETNQKLVNTSLEPGIRPVPVRSQVSGLSQPPGPAQSVEVGPQRSDPGFRPGPRLQDPEPHRGRGPLHQEHLQQGPPPRVPLPQQLPPFLQAAPLPQGPPLDQVPPLHQASSVHQESPLKQEPLLHPPQQVPARRRFRHRPSYKSAVSQDDEDEEEVEEVPVKRSAPGGQWTLSDVSISPSLLNITASPSPPSSSRSPQICIQEDQTPLGPSEVSSEPEADSVPVEVRSIPDPEPEFSLQGSNQNQKLPSSSIYSLSSNDQFYSTAWPPTRTSGRNSISEELSTQTAGTSLRQGPLRQVEPPLHRDFPLHLKHEPPPSREPPLPGDLPLHQEPPLPPPQQDPAGRCSSSRPSYKSALSQDDDDDDDEEEEEVPGGQWTQSVPLFVTDRSISPSFTSIGSPSSPSSSSGRPVPQICIQEDQTPLGPSEVSSEPDSVPAEVRSSPDPEPGFSIQGSNQNQKLPSSSIYSLSSNDQFYSTAWPPTRTSGSSEGLSTQTDASAGVGKIQEVLQRSKRSENERSTLRRTIVPWHRSTGDLFDDQQKTGRLSPLYHSTDCLHDDQPYPPQAPWRHSTGDLLDDPEGAESSDGSVSSSPQLQLRSAVVRRLSTRLRDRMCRSLGTDLDQILQDEGVGGGNDAARRNRLHRISSSLSLSLNRSASSLSSQPSSSVQMGGEDRRHVRRSLTSISSHHEESQVPLDAREHAWMVKAAAGAWTDIYSLFREDKDLLNKPDFISGFTVLHWIAKHGDHRVLNTLWYGVEKVGMNFNINAKSRAGQTPLHVAAIHGHKNVIRLLVSSFKANVALRDTAGKKPWQYLSNSSPDMLELLKAPRRYGGTTGDSSWSAPAPPPQQRHRLQHHFSSASSGLKPSTKVKRSTSIAAFLKNKALTHF